MSQMNPKKFVYTLHTQFSYLTKPDCSFKVNYKDYVILKLMILNCGFSIKGYLQTCAADARKKMFNNHNTI